MQVSLLRYRGLRLRELGSGGGDEAVFAPSWVGVGVFAGGDEGREGEGGEVISLF